MGDARGVGRHGYVFWMGVSGWVGGGSLGRAGRTDTIHPPLTVHTNIHPYIRTRKGIVRARASVGGGGGSHPPVATLVSQSVAVASPRPTNHKTHQLIDTPTTIHTPNKQARAYGGLAWVLNPCRVSYEAFDVQDEQGTRRWSAVAYATVGRHLIAGT